MMKFKIVVEQRLAVTGGSNALVDFKYADGYSHVDCGAIDSPERLAVGSTHSYIFNAVRVVVGGTIPRLN